MQFVESQKGDCLFLFITEADCEEMRKDPQLCKSVGEAQLSRTFRKVVIKLCTSDKEIESNLQRIGRSSIKALGAVCIGCGADTEETVEGCCVRCWRVKAGKLEMALARKEVR